MFCLDKFILATLAGLLWSNYKYLFLSSVRCVVSIFYISIQGKKLALPTEFLSAVQTPVSC